MIAAALAVPGFILIAAVMTLMARMPLRPGARLMRRSAERPSALLSVSLVRSHRGLPERPPAAISAGRVYEITDARER